MTKAVKGNGGFTLIEIIGVLAVISILASMVAPRVFSVIADSRATRAASDVRAYSTAIADWYSDMGTLQGLVLGTGLPNVSVTDLGFQLGSRVGATATAGRWPRWSGPYVEKLDTATAANVGTGNLGVGATFTIGTAAGATGTAAATSGEGVSWDLNDDGTNDMAGRTVVAMTVTSVTWTDYNRIDLIIDDGLSGAANTTQGRVKCACTTTAVGNMYIYLASQ